MDYQSENGVLSQFQAQRQAAETEFPLGTTMSEIGSNERFGVVGHTVLNIEPRCIGLMLLCQTAPGGILSNMVISLSDARAKWCCHNIQSEETKQFVEQHPRAAKAIAAGASRDI